MLTQDTVELPPLAEAMTARDLWLHARSMQAALGGKAEVHISTRNATAGVNVYPTGLVGHGDSKHFSADTWPEAFAAARAWIANHATVHRDNRIRAMALAIIDLTDQHGRCDRAMLTRREFSGAEVDDLKDPACVRAGELAGNAPFSVEA